MSEAMDDYLQHVFGGLRPQPDVDAAARFALSVAAGDGRLGEIAQLLDARSELGGVGGEPGWLVERRHPSDLDWPAGARFRVSVDPDSFHLAHPETFLTEAEMRDVLARLSAFASQRGTP